MFERAIEKQAACAAAISCSGFEPGPSSKRDLNVYPPLIVSPAVNVPVPVGMSPFHSALPLAGIVASSLVNRARVERRRYSGCRRHEDEWKSVQGRYGMLAAFEVPDVVHGFA